MLCDFRPFLSFYLSFTCFIIFIFFFFFFQAEDGIRDLTVTGVQTCALPISFNTFCARAEPLAQTRAKVLKAAADATGAVETENTAHGFAHGSRALLKSQAKGLCPGSQSMTLSLHAEISLRTPRGRSDGTQGKACRMHSEISGELPPKQRRPASAIESSLPPC